MKIKIILMQIFYFSLQFCLTLIFHTRFNGEFKAERVFITHSDWEIILEIFLLLGLSLGMGRYILKSDRMIHTTFWSGISLFLLFEASKYIEYLLGYLPNYLDVPIISLLLSFMLIFVYMSVLYVACLLWKRKNIGREIND